MHTPCNLHADPWSCVLQPSMIRWASRWDTYLLMTDDQIHWFSIINSLMIVLFLSGMVAMIMMRTLHRDISNYNQLETVEEAQEETGWKLVSATSNKAQGLLCTKATQYPDWCHDVRRLPLISTVIT